MAEQQREALEALDQIEALAGWTTAEEIERLTAIVRAALSHAEGEAVTFTCHGNSAPAYSCNKPGDMSGTYYPAPQVVFSDTQEEIEARLADQLENSCPHCGGSGHKDDVAAPQVAVPEGLIQQLRACQSWLGADREDVEDDEIDLFKWDSLQKYIDLLAAAPTAPAGEQLFGNPEEFNGDVVPRSAAQQPVSDPDGLAATERPGALMEAAGLLKIARSKMGADDDECDSDEEATRWRRMAAVEQELRELVKHSAPAPDEREIAAPTCEWFTDDEWDGDNWESECGASWTFPDGGPAENAMKFCPECGSKIRLRAGKEGE